MRGTGEERASHERHTSPRGIRITSWCRNYCLVGRGRAANGTGCFALVETNNKSRKLNRRYRLSVARTTYERLQRPSRRIRFVLS